MHQSAKKYGKAFFDSYYSNDFSEKIIIDVGSQDINGSLREFCPIGAKYIGVDFVEGNGVDVILKDPYQLPFDDEYADAIVCSSVFEHSEFFWLLFLECIRVLKPNGLIYINVPSNGKVHRYPIDGWRFYPDAGMSLVRWARRNKYSAVLLESFIGEKLGPLDGEGVWNDFVSVILKDEKFEHRYPSRIQSFQGELFCGYSSNWDNISDADIRNPDSDLIVKFQETINLLEKNAIETGIDIELLSKTNDTRVANDQQIDTLRNMLSERDGRISGLNGMVDRLQHQIIKHNEQLSARDKHIEKIRQASVEQKKHEAVLIQSLLQKETAILDSKELLGEQDNTISILLWEIQALRNSTSWRITKPLRIIGHQYARMKLLIRIVPVSIEVSGGIRAVAAKAIALYRREGISGVKRGIIHLHSILMAKTRGREKIAATANETKNVFGIKNSAENNSKSNKAFAIINNGRSIPVLDIEPGRESFLNYKKPKKIEPKVKIIAFYLPQFHPFEENDKWWGKGFTEWTNVGKALPNYEGHYQPHCPIHFGYYDLRIPSVMEEQAKLAKEFGIYGFSYYFYWFGGTVLMESPLKLMLENKDIDMPFCFTWANENWSRRWDGQENDILIAQQHGKEDSLNFIDYLIPYFKDERYIKINGCPVLIVYRANLIPDVFDTQLLWRQRVLENGFKGLYLISAQTFGIRSPVDFGFDASVEFPPHTISSTDVSHKLNVTNPDFTGHIYSYDQVVSNAVAAKEPAYKLFRTSMLSWDNTARKQNNSHIFHDFSIRRYMQWLSANVNNVYSSSKYSKDEKIVFVNAWNEWAEGTHLEPDRRYGFAYLQATYDVIKNYVLERFDNEQSVVVPANSKVAVVVHLHYIETWPDIREAINNGFGAMPFDLYVTTTLVEGTSQVLDDFPFACIELVENRGRDVFPFVKTLSEIVDKKYICAVKIHSKRSLYRHDGELIRSELFGTLLKDHGNTTDIVDRFEKNSKLGMLVPEKYFLEHTDLNMTFDEEIVLSLCDILDVEFARNRFPAGSMFWFRPEALERLIKLTDGSIFEIESGLADGTAAHGIERLFAIISSANGFEVGVC